MPSLIVALLGWMTFDVSRLCDSRVAMRALGSQSFFCETNSDCVLPKVCCDGPIFNFCCDFGATSERIRRRNQTWFPPPVIAGVEMSLGIEK